MRNDGESDRVRAEAALAQRLPRELAPLARVAFNYRWSWLPDGARVFREVDPHRWEQSQNPVRLLQECSAERLTQVAGDRAFIERARALEQAITADRARAFAGPLSPERPAAFICAEYGLHPSLPIYAGGLGGLAGDLLKEASDRAVPLVAVGLLYRQGYFRQRIDLTGWQHEFWNDVDPEHLPMVRVTGEDGRPLVITVPLRGREVLARIWRVDVGRVPLFLLDAELPGNSRMDRWITAQLYVGDRSARLAQYGLLGLGGIRALRAMGIEPGLIHLNEGHAALASLELALGRDLPLDEARSRTVFTTHTPVPAGNELYGTDEVMAVFGGAIQQLGLEAQAFLALGQTHPGGAGEPFGMTQLGMRMSRSVNAVSRRHGEVVREMWRDLYPGRPVHEIPIRHVTNGVHVPSWIGEPMRALLERYLGAGWEARARDPATWAAVDSIPDEELWAARGQQRAELVEYVRDRSVANRLSRGEPNDYVEAAARAFSPDVLTIGFARRLATYKRLHLLVQDVGRAMALLHGPRPVQIVIAGKAHPKDDGAKRIVQGLFAVKQAPHVSERVVYLEDYGLEMATQLTRGCDLWLNLPRPPQEASGTSGMKSAMNGGLQLSVLDGWWPEAYDGGNGWAISGDVLDDPQAQDARDADALYALLENEVIPGFYDRDESGLPRGWLQRLKRSLRTIGPAFSAGRMLEEYVRGIYSVP